MKQPPAMNVEVVDCDGTIYKFTDAKPWRIECGILHVETKDGTEGGSFANWRTVSFNVKPTRRRKAAI